MRAVIGSGECKRCADLLVAKHVVAAHGKGSAVLNRHIHTLAHRTGALGLQAVHIIAFPHIAVQIASVIDGGKLVLPQCERTARREMCVAAEVHHLRIILEHIVHFL